MSENRNIAEIFFKAGFIETWGRGVSKIQKGFLDKGMEEPTFEFSMGGLWMVMRRREMITLRATPRVTPRLLQIMGTEEQVEKLFELFEEKVECKFWDIKELLAPKDEMYVRNAYLKPLLEAGILKLKYPDSPNHPKQRYLLNEIK